MATFVALIRGINVGRNRRLPMAELREVLTAAGYENVRTLLQSGNVVLESSKTAPAVAREIETQIADRFGYDVDVMVRTAKEWAAVVRSDPLGDVADHGSKHFVSFLSEPPKASVLRELEQEDFAPEQFAADGREIHIWCPLGLRDSRIIKALSEKRLGVRATVRNWNTVAKLDAMLDG